MFLMRTLRRAVNAPIKRMVCSHSVYGRSL